MATYVARGVPTLKDFMDAVPPYSACERPRTLGERQTQRGRRATVTEATPVQLPSRRSMRSWNTQSPPT